MVLLLVLALVLLEEACCKVLVNEDEAPAPLVEEGVKAPAQLEECW